MLPITFTRNAIFPPILKMKQLRFTDKHAVLPGSRENSTPDTMLVHSNITLLHSVLVTALFPGYS